MLLKCFFIFYFLSFRQSFCPLEIRIADPYPHGNALFMEAWSGTGSKLKWKARSGSSLKSNWRSFKGLKIKLRRGMDAHKGGLEAQNGVQDGPLTSGRRFPSLMRIRIRIKLKGRLRIRIEVKIWIRTRIKVMRILHPFWWNGPLCNSCSFCVGVWSAHWPSQLQQTARCFPVSSRLQTSPRRNRYEKVHQKRIWNLFLVLFGTYRIRIVYLPTSNFLQGCTVARII